MATLPEKHNAAYLATMLIGMKTVSAGNLSTGFICQRKPAQSDDTSGFSYVLSERSLIDK
nr:hypothetical protein [Erwinia sp. Ejp617]